MRVLFQEAESKPGDQLVPAVGLGAGEIVEEDVAQDVAPVQPPFRYPLFRGGAAGRHALQEFLRDLPRGQAHALEPIERGLRRDVPEIALDRLGMEDGARLVEFEKADAERLLALPDAGNHLAKVHACRRRRFLAPQEPCQLRPAALEIRRVQQQADRQQSLAGKRDVAPLTVDEPQSSGRHESESFHHCGSSRVTFRIRKPMGSNEHFPQDKTQAGRLSAFGVLRHAEKARGAPARPRGNRAALIHPAFRSTGPSGRGDGCPSPKWDRPLPNRSAPPSMSQSSVRRLHAYRQFYNQKL